MPWRGVSRVIQWKLMAQGLAFQTSAKLLLCLYLKMLCRSMSFKKPGDKRPAVRDGCIPDRQYGLLAFDGNHRGLSHMDFQYCRR